MSIIEVLAAVVSTDKERPNLCSPYGIEFEGRKWACATDGKMLAALPFDGELRTDGPDPLGMLREMPATHSASVAGLLRAAGEMVMTKCDGFDCDNGDCNCGCENTPPHKCRKCAGTGKMPELRPRRMLRGTLNPDLLSRLLSTAPKGSLLSVGQADEKDPYVFRGSNWIGLLMPMATFPEHANAPSLDCVLRARAA